MKNLAQRLGWLLNPDGPTMEERKLYAKGGYKIVKEHTSGTLIRYKYRDGFVCEAYTLAQADKKHRKWWKEVGRKKGGREC